METLSQLDFVKLMVEPERTIPFPIHIIRNELTMMLVAQEEYFYLLQICYQNIKKRNGRVTALILMNLIEVHFGHDVKPEELPFMEYHDKLAAFIDKLERIRITKIPKEEPDYELLTEMSKKYL